MIEWHERRYPDDYGGWLPIATIRGDKYLVLESPDKRYQCVVHRADNHVAAVLEGAETVYTHPVSVEGAKILLKILTGEADERYL